MPSSNSEEWADDIVEALRRHEEELASSSGTNQAPSAGSPGVPPSLDPLRAGALSGSESSAPGETQTPSDDLLLGRIAIERRLISHEQLKEALQEQAHPPSPGGVRPLGSLFVERGWVTAESLQELLAEQARQAQGMPQLPRYEFRGRLGEGATAVVYRAWDRDLKRPVAIKVLRETSALSEIARERFRREAATAAGLAHPNLVQVYDAGESGGQLHIVMELVDGRPLSEVLKEGKKTQRDLLWILEKSARGLGAAHEKGIVHRDVKPANLLVTNENEPKIGDFGLAHLAESKTQLTRTGTTLGTPLYMSPEQVEGRPKDISPRTDVYALGAILYEILTARTPHQGETLAEIYGKIVREEPIAPRRLNAAVSRDLETIAQKALERDPRNRYPSAREFSEDLRRTLEGEPIEARPISRAERLWRKAKKRRAIVLPVTGAIILGTLVGILVARKATHPANLMFLERMEGEVKVVALDLTKTIASPGQILREGQGIETGHEPSLALLRFEDGTRLEIGPDTSLGGLGALAAKRLTISKGRVLASLARVQSEPMLLATPHGSAKTLRATFVMMVDPDPKKGLRLEVLEGSAELGNSTAKPTVIQAGFAADLVSGGEIVAHAIPAKPRPAAFIYRGWDAKAWGAVLQTVTLVPGRMYTLSVWIRTSNPFPGGIAGVRAESGSVIAQQAFGPSKSYSRTILAFKAGSNPTAVIFAGFASGTATGTAPEAWIQLDDWNLIENGGDGTNLIRDPDYEGQSKTGKALSSPWFTEGPSRNGTSWVIGVDPDNGRTPLERISGGERK